MNEHSFSADFVRMTGERYTRIIKQSVESFYVLKSFFSDKTLYTQVVYDYEPKFLVNTWSMPVSAPTRCCSNILSVASESWITIRGLWLIWAVG